jgi:Flp pilus assembly protein TadB
MNSECPASRTEYSSNEWMNRQRAAIAAAVPYVLILLCLMTCFVVVVLFAVLLVAVGVRAVLDLCCLPRHVLGTHCDNNRG